MIPTGTKPQAPRRGVVAILVAICLTFIVGMVAIAIDGGLLYLELRRTRAVADAAAMAAACDLFENYPTNSGTDPDGVAKNRALTVAQDNGLITGSVTRTEETNSYTIRNSQGTVTVNIPPTSGPYAGKNGYAEVIIDRNVERTFGRIFGTATLPVHARAVSRGAWVAPNAGVLILDYDDSSSLNAQGNGAFTETGGPVIVNSNNPNALVTTGNGAVIGQEFYITGGVKVSGGANLQSSPTPGLIYTGTHPTPDPLAYLPVPSVPPNGTITQVSIGSGNKRYTLTPGRFHNLPQFNTGDEVVFKQASAGNGGIYYIDGGGFKSTGATLTMDTGTTGGIMLYNAPQSTASSEKIQITGNKDGKVNLSPLTDGPYRGMMLWQDRNSPVDALVEGNGDFSIRGTFYAAGARLNINGNGKTATGTVTGFWTDDNGNRVDGSSRIGSQYISKNLSLGGNGNISITYKGPDVARTRIIALVE
jgi:hypothetical protein